MVEDTRGILKLGGGGIVGAVCICLGIEGAMYAGRFGDFVLQTRVEAESGKSGVSTRSWSLSDTNLFECARQQ